VVPARIIKKRRQKLVEERRKADTVKNSAALSLKGEGLQEGGRTLAGDSGKKYSNTEERRYTSAFDLGG